MTQDRFQLAATYSDEWVKGESPAGPFWVRMFWICQKRTHETRWEGNRQGRCLSMTTSKAWHQNKEGDPLAEGQSWTCNCQRHQGYSEGKFLGGHGVLCEMKLPGIAELCYVKAEAPDGHVNDVRAIHYERTLNPETPEALYQMVPVAHPSPTQVVKKHHKWEGWYEISPEDFDALPSFDWWSIFSVTGMKFERGLTKAQQKLKKDAGWYAGEYLEKYNRQLDEWRTKEEGDKTALQQWLGTRTCAGSASSSSK